MKLLFSLLSITLLSGTLLAQAQPPTGFDLSNFGVKIEPDKRVMAVLATIEAARTTNEKGEPVQVIATPLSAQGQKFRDLLTSDLAKLDPGLRQRISTFLIQYKKRNPGKSEAEILAPFISMAYALSPAPALSDPVVTGDLPGSLLDVLDFAPLVRDFYRGSSFSANLPEYVKSYQSAADKELRGSAAEMVNELLNYLHTRPQLVIIEKVTTETKRSKSTTLKNTESRERERHFLIVPEMLAPVDTVNFVNVKDDYYAIVPPDTNLVGSEVRRAFLQFVVDPIVLKYAKEIASVGNAIKAVGAEQKVSTTVSPDVFLIVSRSLVAAVDVRQSEFVRRRIATQQAREKIDKAPTDDEKKKISAGLKTYTDSLSDESALRLSEEFKKGSILDFYFYDQLAGVEDSGFDIAASMREMILSFEPGGESGRYEKYAAARKRADAEREARRTDQGTPALISDNPVTAGLLEIQKTVDAKNYAKAEADLNALLNEHPGEARIYYNLGRVASLQAVDITDPAKQAEKLTEAKVAFENVIRIGQKSNIDPALRSLALVAMAKIYEFFDDKTYALALYEAAIKTGNVTGGAFNEAMTAKQRLLKDQ